MGTDDVIRVSAGGCSGECLQFSVNGFQTTLYYISRRQRPFPAKEKNFLQSE